MSEDKKFVNGQEVGATIVILNDGETWTNVEKCQVVDITQAGLETLECCNEPEDVEGEQVIRALRISSLVALYEFVREHHPDVYDAAMDAGVGFK